MIEYTKEGLDVEAKANKIAEILLEAERDYGIDPLVVLKLVKIKVRYKRLTKIEDGEHTEGS